MPDRSCQCRANVGRARCRAFESVRRRLDGRVRALHVGFQAARVVAATRPVIKPRPVVVHVSTGPRPADRTGLWYVAKTATLRTSGIAMLFSERKREFVPADRVLEGRETTMVVSETHFVSGHPICPPFPEGTALAMFGMGCFWGAERKFWALPGVYSTAVGYAGGQTRNPTYREVCSGMTNHNEVVRVVYRPDEVGYDILLRTFWDNHDPTQGMQQGNDVGTQYRSGIYSHDDAQHGAAERSRVMFQERLTQGGFGAITTKIVPAPEFYYAEASHQQYLAKNPGGYCGLGGTGVSCPSGTFD